MALERIAKIRDAAASVITSIASNLRVAYQNPKSVISYLSLFSLKQNQHLSRRDRVAAIVLSWKRPQNLPLVIQGLRKQSYIDDVVVFHNHPSWLRIPGCINIFSDLNLGCVIRHQIAHALGGYDYYVFIDDDLMLCFDMGPEVLPAMIAQGKESVLGFFGHELDVRNEEQMYTSGAHVVCKDRVEPIDIVKGRFHIISRWGIEELTRAGFDTPVLLAEDDVRASVTLQRASRRPSFLIPVKRKIVELQEEHARWHHTGHGHDRDCAVADALKLGWKPVPYDRDYQNTVVIKHSEIQDMRK